jgi:hypothetical protein
MDRHRIRDQRLRLPTAAPVLGFTARSTASASVSAFDGVEFDVRDFHSLKADEQTFKGGEQLQWTD